MVSISKLRKQIIVSGIVQGVGFRPFVYHLAQELNLVGYVVNDGRGVVIEIEGSNHSLSLFIVKLQTQSPPLAQINKLTSKEIPLVEEGFFEIRNSQNSPSTTLLLSDMALCKECRDEMHDPENRRFQYPFINCTNCGPRYSIIKKLPYDRCNSSMNKFTMCEACQREYEDPQSRRYHAQPISCPDCGPHLHFIDMLHEKELYNEDALIETIKKIEDGKSIAIKGLGGFHIICDATNSEAVSRLRDSKHRQTKPLAVMFASLREIKKVAKITKKDIQLLTSAECPIVIVEKKKYTSLSETVAPNINRIGVFLPYTPLHLLLLERLKRPIVATSANISDAPIITDEASVMQKLPLVVDAVLTHDREIVNACDDSVMMTLDKESFFLRLGRGYGPKSFHLLHKTEKKILAVGANQKNTLTFAFNENLILSPYIGDLNSLDSFEYFEQTLETFQRLYNFEPELIVCDKHPFYETSLWAKRYVKAHNNVELIELQHHYAHALATMAEFGLDENVLAFCFDGTGYGDDGTLWGGEVLIASPQNYERRYYFKKLHLLGGEKAIHEPRRVALSLLFECFTLDEIVSMPIPLIKSFSQEELKTLHTMFLRKINAPQSSSLGRLFDAIYALSGYTKPLGYEGESGLIMETLAKKYRSKKSYSYSIEGQEICYREMICEVLQEFSSSQISAKFINTICKIILDISSRHPELPIVLSGGVFQNKLLLLKVTNSLKRLKRRYYFQQQSSINDGGISLGQAYYAVKKYKGSR